MDAASVTARTVRYLGVPAVVGFEQPFLIALEDELAKLGRTTERGDGLLAAPGGAPILSVHIDRHGLVTGETHTLHYAAQLAAGAHRPLTGKLRSAVCQRFARESVVAYEPATGEVVGRGTVQHNAHCGIGPDLDLVVEGLSQVGPGIPVAFANAGIVGDGWLRGQLDNALSAAVAIELVAAGFSGAVLFTCGEEAGRSWEALRAWLAPPTSQLIVLDTSPFDEPAPVAQGVVVLRHADAGAKFDVEATAQLGDAARRAGVEVVWKDQMLASAGRSLGRTELGRLVAATEGRLTGSTLQIPTTDYHSNSEATTEAAISAALDVLAELIW